MSKDYNYKRMIQSARWQRLRKEKIKMNPLCQDCLEAGIYTPAQEVINALSAAVAAEGGNPEKILRPVPQTYGAFTSPVETFEMAAKVVPARVQLSMNPIFPYCFGNCFLDEDKMRNKKPLKRKENLKIDAAIASLMTFWLYNNYEQ